MHLPNVNVMLNVKCKCPRSEDLNMTVGMLSSSQIKFFIFLLQNYLVNYIFMYFYKYALKFFKQVYLYKHILCISYCGYSFLCPCL